jgi:hypothetical protein
LVSTTDNPTPMILPWQKVQKSEISICKPYLPFQTEFIIANCGVSRCK